MKRILVLIVALCLIATSTFAQTYKIDVTIKGLEDSIVVLAEHGGLTKYALDTVKLDKNGRGTFSKPRLIEGGMCFLVSNSTALFDFLISDGDEHIGIVADKSDYSKVKFINSPENDAMLEYIAFRNKQQESYQELMKKIEAANDDEEKLKGYREELRQFNNPLIEYSENLAKKFEGKMLSTIVRALKPLQQPEFNIAEDDPERNTKIPMALYQYNKIHFFDNVNLTDDRLLRTPFFERDLFDYYFDNVLVFKNPDSIMPCIDMVLEKTEPNKAMFKYSLSRLFNKYYKSLVMGHESIVIHLGENYYLTEKVDWENPKFTKELVEFINNNKSTLMGKTSPDLILPTLGKKYESIHGLTANYIILYFYDPDCGHCKKDTPLMKGIIEKYKEKMGLQIYAVNAQTDEKKWMEFIENYGVEDWINVWDPQRTSNMYRLFNTSTTPQIYLLDKDKKIIGRRLDPENLEKFIQMLIRDKERSEK